MDTTKINSGKTKIVAHRGLSGIERENTCPAFVAAGNRSYFGIETDVHITRDGKFVIIHDNTTERVSLGAHCLNVEECDYSALEDIVLPDTDGSRDRQDIRIPLLKEYILLCKKYNKVCVLEIKSNMTQKDIDGLIEEIRGLEYLHKVIFISFYFSNCAMVRKRLPDNDVAFLTSDDITEELLDSLCENHMDIDIDYTKLNKEKIDLLHSRGIRVNCWTCDDKDRAEELVSYGVDYITTNILE